MRRVLILLLLLLGCSDKKKEPPRAAAADGAPAKTSDGGAAQAHAPTLVPRGDVETFLARWLDVQNRGDFDAYSALYADELRGVRRSGKQTVRMDRHRWIADRKKMFAKPMKVAAGDVEITVSPRGALVRFTQDWASGTYHDVGPKQLELEARPAGLVVIREEMLASNLVKPPPVAAGGWPMLPVYRGAIVLADQPPPAWGGGKMSLDAGEVREQDADLNCEDAPDYEREQERYWQCHDSDPSNAHDRFVASEDVDRKAVAPTHAAWIGRSVRLGGGRAPCTAKVTGLRLLGEWEATYEAVTAGGASDTAIATAVLARSPVLVAVVDGGCEASWAVSADAPAPVAWTMTPAATDLAKRALRALEKVDGYADLIDEPYGGAAKVAATVIAGPGGRRLVLATRDGYRSCQEAGGVAGLFELSKSGAPTLVLETSDPVDLEDAIDANGDGWPEIVLADGLLLRTAGTWDRWRPLDFPDEVGDCYCECE